MDFCYPPRCAACECYGPVHLGLCAACQEKLAAITIEGACPYCARPVPAEVTGCPTCRGNGLAPYERLASLGRYGPPVRRLIHQMKYHRRWGIAEQLAQRLLEHRRTRELIESAEVLAPVPLHWWRHFQRGFNQSQIIAARLGRCCRLPVVQPAARIRNTPTQTMRLSRTARRQNMQGAFALRRPHLIEGKRVLVIDDVMTTGATLLSLGRELAKARPTGLAGLVIAQADPRHQEFQAL